MTDLSHFSREYNLSHLEESTINPDPLIQFGIWMKEAIQANIKDPTGMTLSTVNEQGTVSSRIVLLKSFDETGFTFFSNYLSPKAQALAFHPQASLLFWWSDFERQVRIQGRVQKVAPEVSDAYFQQRPKESNLAAILSKQSAKLDDKQAFIDLFESQNKTQGADLKRPDHWGGFVLKPNYFEFWQGGPHRVHDRLSFEQKDEKWALVRLYP